MKTAFGNRAMHTRTKDFFAIYMSKGEGKCNWDTQKWFFLFLHFDFTMAGWFLLFRIFYLDYCLPSKVYSWMIDGLNSKDFGLRCTTSRSAFVTEK